MEPFFSLISGWRARKASHQLLESYQNSVPWPRQLLRDSMQRREKISHLLSAVPPFSRLVRGFKGALTNLHNIFPSASVVKHRAGHFAYRGFAEGRATPGVN